MAQIYKEQVKTEVTPIAPDTGLMSLFDKRRKGAIKALASTADAIDENRRKMEEKRAKKAEDSFNDNLEAKALQIYKNGFSLYDNDVEKYNEFTTTELKKLYDATPESDEKRKTMAKVAIAGSGYDAKVTRKHWDIQEKTANMRFRDATFTSMDSATEGLGSLFAASDNNLTDEQKYEQMQAFADAQIPLFNAYENRLAVDSNGNAIFTTAERALIEDKWNNRGAHAVIDYAGENIETNREGVIALRNRLVDNQDELKEQLGIDDASYAKTLDDLDKIIKGQTTAKDLKRAEIAKIVNSATVEDMKIKVDGSVENNRYDNIDTTVSVYRQLEQAEREGAYTSRADREKLAEEKGKVAKAIIKQIEDEVGLREKSATDVGFLGILKLWGNANVGETAVFAINENIAKLESSPTYRNLTEDRRNEIKANMYIEVLGSLKEAEGIELKDKNNPESIEMAKRIAAGVFYKEIRALVGGKVSIDNLDDPVSVEIGYENALHNDNRKKSLESLQERLRLLRGK